MFSQLLLNAGMSTNPEIQRANLQLLVDELGGVGQLAARIERTDSQVSQWLNGSINSGTGKPRGMRPESARMIEAKCGKSRGWMDINHKSNVVEIGSQDDSSDDIRIPQFDVGGGMGRPTLLLDDQPGVIRNWDVDEPWIRHNVRNHTGLQNLCIVTGFGPSMQPLYNPGDPLLVDRGVKTVDIDGIFFFRIADHGYIKWLQRIPKGPDTILMATSENSRFVPFEITKDMDFEVLGRVLTVWKSSQF